MLPVFADCSPSPELVSLPAPGFSSKTTTAIQTGPKLGRTTVLLGHWHKRTWELAQALSEDKRIRCVAAVTDLRDALVVLKAAISPVEVLLCSQYYELEDVQDMLEDYNCEISLVMAPSRLIDNRGISGTSDWACNAIANGDFTPKTCVLSPSASFLRRLSDTS
ncbi:hypothetical protein JCM1840_006552 [Sporobolomyces johnsonii]